MTSVKKLRICEEFTYLLGLVLIALSVSLMTKAGFGVSMIVAPAYVIFLKFSAVFPFLTFGMAEYLFQLVLLLLMILIVRRIRLFYLFSFVTAVLYGVILDLLNLALSGFVPQALYARILTFLVAAVICSLGVALMFRSYVAPEVYELFVKEISLRYHRNMTRVKWIYDAISLVVALLLSNLFFGFFSYRGVGLGTVFCAVFNGPTIGFIGKFLDRHFEFHPALSRLKALHQGKSEKGGAAG